MARYSKSKPELSRGSRTPADPAHIVTEGPDYTPPVSKIEDPGAYNEHLQILIDFYRPQNEHIARLVREYAEASWREQRYAEMEEELIDLQLSDSFNDVERDYPNADNRLHGTIAFRKLCASNDLQIRSVLHARAQSSTANKYRALESALRRPRG